MKGRQDLWVSKSVQISELQMHTYRHRSIAVVVLIQMQYEYKMRRAASSYPASSHSLIPCPGNPDYSCCCFFKDLNVLRDEAVVEH